MQRGVKSECLALKLFQRSQIQNCVYPGTAAFGGGGGLSYKPSKRPNVRSEKPHPTAPTDNPDNCEKSSSFWIDEVWRSVKLTNVARDHLWKSIPEKLHA